MSQMTAELIAKHIDSSEKTGRLSGLELEFWTGGGLPPPNYRSDQLRLKTVEGKDVAEFASLRWDKAFDPPNVQDKWTAALNPDDVQKVLRLIQSENLFAVQFPEEIKPGIADIFSYEIIATADGREQKKTYYRKLPSQLEPLQVAFEALIELAKTRGRQSLFHQGKEVRR